MKTEGWYKISVLWHIQQNVWHFYLTLFRQIDILETTFWGTFATELHFYYNVLRLIDRHTSKFVSLILIPADGWRYSSSTVEDRDIPQNKVKEPTSLSEAIPLRDTDWSLCCPCQTSGGNTCPATNGYPESNKTFSKNIIALDKINQLPFPIDIRGLDNWSGIVASLLENKAIIHKMCRKKNNNERVRWTRNRIGYPCHGWL